MTAELVVRVYGTPAPQGSKSFKGMRAGRPVLVESSKKVAPWRDDVERATEFAILARGGVWIPLDGPLLLHIEFRLKPPKTLPKGRAWPTTYPDLSKLVRSTEDALVRAKAVRDDSRFVREVTEKRYCTGDERPGATIRIAAMSEQGALL